jgi:WD40 repeat protein
MQFRGNFFWFILAASACLLADGIVRAADDAGPSNTATASTSAADTTKPASKAYSLSVKAEPLAVVPGQPLSIRALVTHPVPLGDAISWTIESRKHRGNMHCMSLSPDGTKLVTGGVDSVVRIWDLATGELLRAMVGHNHYIHGVSWSPDGTVIASAGSWDGTIRLWDAKSGMPLRVFKVEKGYCYHVSWSPDGSKLLGAGGTSGWVWLWDAREDKTQILVEVGQHIYSIAWAPDNEHYAVTALQSPVSVYEISSVKAVNAIGEATVVNYSVRWSPDGTRLAVGSGGEINIYEMPDAKPLKKIKQTGYQMAWSPDSKLLASSASAAFGTMFIFDSETIKLVRKIPAAGYDVLWPAADKLVTRGYFDAAVCNPQDGKQLAAYNLGGSAAPIWTPSRPIITGLGDNTLALWDNNTAKALRTLEGHKAATTALSWTRDGKTLATSSYDKTVAYWETSTGERLHEITDYKATVMCLAWSPDGKTLAAGGGDNQVRLFNLAAKELGALQGHTNTVNKVTWAPRGNLVASGSADSTVRIWNADKQQQLHEMPSVLPVQSLAFSPDGSLLAAGTSDDAIQSWMTSTGQPLNRNMRVTGSPRNVSALAWAPNGALLLAGRGNYTVQLWSWLEPKVVHNFSTYAPVQYVMFASGLSTMVTGSADRTTRFWDTAAAELRGSIVDLGSQVLLVTADGHYRYDTSHDAEFVYIVQTPSEQAMLKPADFTSKYRWKNAQAAVKFNR